VELFRGGLLVRERREEIGILLRHFVSQIAESYGRPSITISPKLMEACERYPWPGNLRELGNFVKRFLILGDEELAIQELQAGTAGGPGSPGVQAGSEGGLKGLVRNVKDEAEIEAITRALEQTNWNRKKAATLLQISYKALLYKIRQYDIQRSGSMV